mgnify:CR=1 FL=1
MELFFFPVKGLIKLLRKKLAPVGLVHYVT